MRRFMLLLLLLTLSLGMVGCNEDKFMNLRGSVQDRFTGEVLSGVQVEIANFLVESNANGYFILEDIPVIDDLKVEDRLIKVTAPGYRTYVQELSLEEGDKRVDIKLDTKERKEFIFVSDKDGHKNIYLSDIYGDNITQLTQDRGNNWAPNWSEERKKIIFLSDRNGHSNIYTMKADGSNLQQITYTTSNKEDPIWLNKDEIIFASDRDGDYELYQTNLSSSYLKKITDNNHYDGQVSYSSANNKLLYVSETTGEKKIHIMNQDGQGKMVLHTGFGKDSHPSWSADGRTILFTNQGDSISTIYRINPNGSGLKKVLDNKSKIYDYASYDHKGELILFVVEEDGAKSIKILSSQNKIESVLFEEDRDYDSPEWK
ncbi:DUF5050 domain-containing protein [Orenia marismortui]|uniref:TolB protein n=1 Tax=Orenia marismortui TaxID=46469 RepID=A0A4R8HGB6_9FIRM|nr:DUF5050 domain-containing protein [Orenia marismortui]TDX59286.1 TolB protein [Orenia marismortui]